MEKEYKRQLNWSGWKPKCGKEKEKEPKLRSRKNVGTEFF